MKLTIIIGTVDIIGSIDAPRHPNAAARRLEIGFRADSSS
jgi:hypothetical protein